LTLVDPVQNLPQHYILTFVIYMQRLQFQCPAPYHPIIPVDRTI